MRIVNRVWRGFAPLFRKDRAERELDDELREFLQAAVDAKLASGMRRDAAERAARLELGSAAAVKDWTRDVGWEWRVESVWQDVRYASRILRRAPGFALAAIGTLALGLGATAAMYAIVDAVLLKPLPYLQPERIVDVRLRVPGEGTYGVAAGTIARVRALPAVEYAAAVTGAQHTMIGGHVPLLVSGEAATGEFFQVLGIQAAAGRTFTAADGGRGPVVVLADSLWRRAFAAREDVVGRSVQLNGVPHAVVGIMPPGFTSPYSEASEYWVLRPFAGADLAQQGKGPFHAFVRLRTGKLESARAQVAAVAVAPSAGAERDEGSLTASPILESAAEYWGRTLWSLLGAVGVVLLLACGNVANLLVGRARTRHAELVMRAAIGASRGRIVRQMITEAFVLAAIAAGLAAALASLLIQALPLLPIPEISRLDQAALDVRVGAFLAALAFATVLFFGVAPAFAAARAGAVPGAGRSATWRGARRTSQALIAGEIAATLLLLVGTGLVALRIRDLLSLELGFEPANLRMASVRPMPSEYRGEALTAFYGRVADRLRERTGLHAVIIDRVPMDRWLARPVRVQAGAGDDAEPHGARIRTMSAGALRYIGAEIISGRDFTPEDRPGAPQVAVVNEALARRLWGRIDRIGAPVVVVRDRERHPLVVVGVVGDMRDSYYRAPWPEIYVSAAQFPTAQASIVVRSDMPGETLSAAVRQAVLDVDPRQAVADVVSLAEIARTHTAYSRFVASLFAMFAGLAVVLAISGVFAVAAGAVASRRREIGIRVAVGAAPRDVLVCLSRDFGAPVVLGVVVGLTAGYWLTGMLRWLAPGVAAFHPLVYGAAVGAIVLITAAGASLPARRALAIDPARTLGVEEG